MYVLQEEKDSPIIRQRFIDIAVRQELEVESMNANLQRELSLLIQEYSDQNKIQDKDAIEARLPGIFNDWADVFAGLLISHNSDVIEVLRDESVKVLTREKADYRLIQSVQKRAEVFLSDMESHLLDRVVPQNRYTIGERIKTITGSNLNTVRNILELGLRNGVSAEILAKQIDMIINPAPGAVGKSPFEYYRERFGYDQAKKVNAVQPGSASYQSKRIARTEINNTYRYDMVNLHQGSKFVLGFMWNLSLAHPQYDICDFYNKKLFQTVAQIPVTHPNCICYVTTVLKSGGEF